MAGTHLSPETKARIAAAWPAICGRIAAGELIKDICKELGFHEALLRAFRLQHPDAQRAWDAAKEDSAAAFMEEALEVARDPGILGDKSAHARTRIDTLKWAARIRNPRSYSDKAQLDVNVKTVDLTRIIAEANARLAASRGRTLEHEPAATLADAAGAAIVDRASKLLELF